MGLSIALEQMAGLNPLIDDILRIITYDEHADLRGLHVDNKDNDQLFWLKELRAIMGKLADIGDSIEYLFRPVLETSTLHKDESGEYRTEKGYRYRSGSLIEVLLQDVRMKFPAGYRQRWNMMGKIIT